MDATACNYNSTATCDDSSCLFVDVCGDCGGSGVAGCMDATACNYDSTATCDDSSCLFAAGCMDITKCNYDATACFDDGSCLEWDDCGMCGGNNSSCSGCTHENARTMTLQRLKMGHACTAKRPMTLDTTLDTKLV